MTDTERVVQALKKVKAKRLRIIDLAWEVLDESGDVDYQKAVDRATDIELAIQEAQAYIRATVNAVSALRRLASGMVPGA